jgi:hypothetical protein
MTKSCAYLSLSPRVRGGDQTGGSPHPTISSPQLSCPPRLVKLNGSSSDIGYGADTARVIVASSVLFSTDVPSTLCGHQSCRSPLDPCAHCRGHPLMAPGQDVRGNAHGCPHRRHLPPRPVTAVENPPPSCAAAGVCEACTVSLHVDMARWRYCRADPDPLSLTRGDGTVTLWCRTRVLAGEACGATATCMRLLSTQTAYRLLENV